MARLDGRSAVLAIKSPAELIRRVPNQPGPGPISPVPISVNQARSALYLHVEVISVLAASSRAGTRRMAGFELRAQLILLGWATTYLHSWKL